MKHVGRSGLRLLIAGCLCLVVFASLLAFNTGYRMGAPGLPKSSKEYYQDSILMHGKHRDPQKRRAIKDTLKGTPVLPTDSINYKTKVYKHFHSNKSDASESSTISISKDAKAILGGPFFNFSKRMHIYNTEIKRNILHSHRTCVFMKSEFGKSPVCIYDPKTSSMSASLFADATWQPQLVSSIGNILKREPNIVFLDLNCNIGVFTILAAMLGKQVVAIDSKADNLELLSEALRLAKLNGKVTLMFNGIWDGHSNVSQKRHSNTDRKTPPFLNLTGNDVSNITLDDLDGSFSDRQLFIKISIAADLWNILQGGKLFFKKANIKYIAMELFHQQNIETRNQVVNFMSDKKFTAHALDEKHTLLEMESYRTWTDTILWMKS